MTSLVAIEIDVAVKIMRSAESVLAAIDQGADMDPERQESIRGCMLALVAQANKLEGVSIGLRAAEHDDFAESQRLLRRV